MKLFSTVQLIRIPAPVVGLAVTILLSGLAPARSDMIELVNGDHYRGTVIGMTLTNIDFQSEIQGRVKLPRDKVAQITLHDVTPKHAVVSQSVPLAPMVIDPSVNLATTNTTGVQAGSDAVLQQLRIQGVDPKLVNQIQEQIFGKSSPEAGQKFNELLNGLKTGSISVKDIRVQAQDAIKQIREAKKELGGDAGDMLDGYLGILEKFVADSGGEGVKK